MNVIDDVFVGPAKALEAVFRALENVVSSILNTGDMIRARAARRDIERLNILLNRVMFEPGGVRETLKNFCKHPHKKTWEVVQERIGEGQEIIKELRDHIHQIDRGFAAQNTELFRNLDQAMFMKGGSLRSMYGNQFLMPTDPTDIAKLQALDETFDAVNAIIMSVQARIEQHLKELDRRATS